MLQTIGVFVSSGREVESEYFEKYGVTELVKDLEENEYKIDKVKVMYYLGYGEKIVYMVNLDTNKAIWKEI